MSYSREDWRRFDIVSGTMTIEDLTGKENIVVYNAATGEWYAFAVYDEDNMIRKVVIMLADIARKLPSDISRFTLPGDYSVFPDYLHAKKGVFSLFDSQCKRYQPGYEDKYDATIIKQWGKPDAEDKSDRKRFFELAYHLSNQGGLNVIESASYGCFFRGDGDLDMRLARDNGTGKVIGIEINVKG